MSQSDVERMVDQGIASMQGMFVDVACNLASLLIDDEMTKPNQLMSKSSIESRFKQEVAQELLNTQERIKNGALVLFRENQRQELDKLITLASHIADHREMLIEALSSGRTIQEIAGISDDGLEMLYQTAKKLYEAKDFQQARDAFSFLCMLNSQKFAFWLGLGNSEFGLQNYDAALFAYAFVAEVNPEDYLCHLFSARCYEELQDKDNAINALELALFVIGADSEHHELQNTIQSQIKRLRGE